MAKCLISIGSNLGDRRLAVDSALAQLQAHPAISLRQASGLHFTQPIGGPAAQGEFVNAAAIVETSLPPLELLNVLHSLESAAGRSRDIRWGARPLDLDLLLYDDLVMNDERLVLPHPRMAFRRFVLVPACEIAPDMPHPIHGRSIAQLLEHLDHAPNYVAITGVAGVGKSPAVKSLLVKAVATRVGAEAVLETRPTRSGGTATGPSLQAELELLNNRCGLLRDVRPTGEEPYAISDFWLGQSLAHAKELSPDEYRQVEAAWLKCCRQVVSPKLIVLVEVNFEDVIRDGQTEQLIAVQRNLREQLGEPAQPPSLMLNADNAAWNEEEIAAAILAM